MSYLPRHCPTTSIRYPHDYPSAFINRKSPGEGRRRRQRRRRARANQWVRSFEQMTHSYFGEPARSNVAQASLSSTVQPLEAWNLFEELASWEAEREDVSRNMLEYNRYSEELLNLLLN